MRSYVIRRLLSMVPTLLLVSFIIFLFMRLVPGSIVDIIVAHMEASLGDKDLEKVRATIEESLGLNTPILIQYGRWISGIILRGDFGNSLIRGTSVSTLIASRGAVTLELGFLGLLIAQLIALPIGVYSALRQDSWGDYVARSFAILCIAVPGFWLGTMAIVFPSLWWDYMPPLRLVSFIKDPIRNLQMFVVPAVILGMVLSGTTMRLTRTMMLEVLRQDYVRTAWAKGLSEKVVVARHALKNALIPIVTLIGLQMPVMIGGTVIIEQIFVLPGMGRLMVTAIEQRDYTVVSGAMLVYSIATMLINLLVDLTYGYLDPRIGHTDNKS